jgi:hypothetical protein
VILISPGFELATNCTAPGLKDIDKGWMHEFSTRVIYFPEKIISTRHKENICNDLVLGGGGGLCMKI